MGGENSHHDTMKKRMQKYDIYLISQDIDTPKNGCDLCLQARRCYIFPKIRSITQLVGVALTESQVQIPSPRRC